MTDTAAAKRRVEEFLHFATRERGGSILFGVEFDTSVQKWVAVMTSGVDKVTYPPGAGRALIRELRDRATARTKDLTAQMRADMGISDFAAVFDKMDEACKIAMERNAGGVRPEFFGSLGDATSSEL